MHFTHAIVQQCDSHRMHVTSIVPRSSRDLLEKEVGASALSVQIFTAWLIWGEPCDLLLMSKSAHNDIRFECTFIVHKCIT